MRSLADDEYEEILAVKVAEETALMAPPPVVLPDLPDHLAAAAAQVGPHSLHVE